MTSIKAAVGKVPHWSVKIAVIALCTVFGSVLFMRSHAATPFITVESEAGSISGCANTVNDTTASMNSAVSFGSCSSATSDPSAGAGATLPIQYNLSSLTGTVVYAAPNGSDTSGNGSVSTPYATLTKAVSAAPSGGTVVLRGGTYHENNVNVGKTLKITAYPGETPVFNGAMAVSNSTGWTASGTTSYHAYTPMPVTDGSGISFSTCQNQTSSCMGRYPDQAWVGTKQLQQVATQAEVTTGKFYVDRTNSRIFLAVTDVSTGSIEVSNLRHFISVSAPNVTLSGFKVIRYSNAGGDYGVYIVYGTADNFLMDNMFTSDSAYMDMSVVTSSGPDLNQNSTLKNSTFQYGNWMGVAIDSTNYFKLDHDLISNTNQFNEFTSSPQSGALKTGKTWYTSVLNSQILNNNSQGIWFDESNYKAEVAGNYMDGNASSALFYEISDYIWIANNYIKASGGAKAVKLAGSSDLYMVNNTIIGGADPVGVYVDSRSMPGCSTYTNASCAYDGAGQDTTHTHPATMTWIPTINLFINNIFAYPTASGYCGTTAALCVTHNNASANVNIETIIHKADAVNNIPQTIIDGNVYADGTGNIIALANYGNYTTTGAFGTFAAGSPIGIPGLETRGLYGNGYVNSDGSPTSTLAGKHGSSYSVPTDTIINKYVPAGTTHYGVLWK